MSVIADRVARLPREVGQRRPIAVAREQCVVLASRFHLAMSGQTYFEADSLDASDMIPDEVRAWLENCLPKAPVTAVWKSHDEGIDVESSVLVSHYEDLWFPGSDDLIIISRDGKRVLEMSAEQQFHLLNFKSSLRIQG